jgi:hypothetical protein
MLSSEDIIIIKCDIKLELAEKYNGNRKGIVHNRNLLLFFFFFFFFFTHVQ